MDELLSDQSKIQKLERLANPEWKEEYEMPEWYQERLKQFVELLESRDEYKKTLPTLPPEVYAEALPSFLSLDDAVETLEQQLADEYENYQEQQRRDQELYELTWLQDSMSEELFIWVKHKKPYIFEEFVKYATEGMTDAELEEHYAVIAERETKELDTILSSKTPPAPEYKNLYIKHRLPDEWIAELLLQITKIGFLTDEFFEINFDALERLRETRHDFCFHVSNALPVRRRNMEEAILDIKKLLGSGRRFLLDYTEEAIKSGKFKPLKSGYTEHLDNYLKYLEGCPFWKYVIIKHTQPEKLDEFTRILTEDLTHEETEAFFKRAAECDEKDSRALLESLEYERITAERVNARRAAPDYRKIEGAQLSDRVKMSLAEQKERRYQSRKAATPEKIGRDLTAIFNRYLKALYAVTGNEYAPERYEDEESRKDEEMSKMLDEMEETSNILYILIKHQTPHLFDEFHRIKTLDMLPEELEEFQNKIAHLEATRLDEILAKSNDKVK